MIGGMCSLFVVCWLLFEVCCWLVAGCWLLCVVCCSLFAACWCVLVVVVCCGSFSACCFFSVGSGVFEVIIVLVLCIGVYC